MHSIPIPQGQPYKIHILIFKKKTFPPSTRAKAGQTSFLLTRFPGLSEEPRAPANGRRWSARGFFQRKSHFGRPSPLFRAGHSGFFTQSDHPILLLF
jgi:hypothetical protein